MMGSNPGYLLKSKSSSTYIHELPDLDLLNFTDIRRKYRKKRDYIHFVIFFRKGLNLVRNILNQVSSVFRLMSDLCQMARNVENFYP
jgi:hypothetical protein